MPNYFDELIARDATIQDFFSKAQTEQAEATAARKDYATVAEQTTLEEINALRSHSQNQARNAAETASALDGLSSASEALYDRQTSFLATQLEPLMQLVDPENSILGLSSRVRNAQTQLAVTQSRSELQQRSYQIGAEQRAKSIEIKRLQAANEQSDVEDMQRLIALQQGSQNQAVFTASQLKRGSVAQMRQAVKAGLMTQEDMDGEIVRRDMRGLNVKAAHRADFLQTLETMSVPELKARAEQKPNEAETILRVIQRKENQDMAHEVAMRSGMLSRYENESPENIRAAVERGDLLPGEAVQLARQQTANRIAFENLVQAQKDAALQRGAAYQKLVEENRKQWLATAPLSVLEELNTKAIDGDGIATIPGTDVKVRADELQTAMQNHTQALAHDAMTSAAIDSSRRGLTNTANAMAASLGLPATDGQDPLAVYETILADPTTPNSVKSNIRSVVTLLGQMNKTTGSDSTHALVLARADELLAQSRKQLEETRRQGMSPAMKAAHTQFVEQNRVLTNRDLATGVIGEQVFQPGITTGKPVMDSALRSVQAAAQSLMKPPTLTNEGGGGALDVLQQAQLEKQAETYAKHPERAVSVVLRDPEKRREILTSIANETRFQLYRQVWETQGDEQMLAMAANRNSQLYTNDPNTGRPVFDETAMAEFYKTRQGVPNRDWSTFSAAVKKSAPAYIESQLQPEGPEAVTVAALNEILFRNQAAPVIANSVKSELDAITAIAIGEAEATTTSGVAPPPAFPVRVDNREGLRTPEDRAQRLRERTALPRVAPTPPEARNPIQSPSDALNRLLDFVNGR